MHAFIIEDDYLIGQSLRDTLSGQMEYTYFPVTPEAFGAEVRTVFPGDERTAVKDPVVRVRDGLWEAWICCHPLDVPAAEDRMTTETPMKIPSGDVPTRDQIAQFLSDFHHMPLGGFVDDLLRLGVS